MSHGFELGDEALLACRAGPSLVEVVAAEVGVDLAGGQQVPGDDQDRVADGDRRTPGPTSATNAVADSAGRRKKLGELL